MISLFNDIYVYNQFKKQNSQFSIANFIPDNVIRKICFNKKTIFTIILYKTSILQELLILLFRYAHTGNSAKNGLISY